MRLVVTAWQIGHLFVFIESTCWLGMRTGGGGGVARR